MSNKKTIATAILAGAALIFSVNYWIISIGESASQQQSRNWYVYGLWMQKPFDEFKRELEPYEITLVGRGCVIGTAEYDRDMRSNQRLYDNAPVELKALLNPKRSY